MEDLTAQTVDTSIAHTEWNPFFQELKDYIEKFDTMDVAETDQLRRAVVSYILRTQFYADGGAVNAHVLTVLGGLPSPYSLGEGMVARFRPVADNTSSTPTANLTGLGAKTIVREDGTALIAGDLSTDRDALLRYDGTSWRLSNGSLGAPQQALPDRFIAGLALHKNPSEPIAEFRGVSFQPGSCRSVANDMNLSFSSAFVKRFDTVDEGPALGGFPSATLGAPTVSTWYRVFIVGNADGVIDGGFDSVANDDAAALLTDLNVIRSGWGPYRQVGWVRTSFGVIIDLVPFLNDASNPNEFIWTGGEGFADYDPGSARVAGINAMETITIDFCPPDAVAILDFMGFTQSGAGQSGAAGIAHPVGHPDIAPTRTLNTLFGDRVGIAGGGASTPATTNSTNKLGLVRCRVDASQQMNVRWFMMGTLLWPFATTTGFVFER